jgi:hypothetical protein
MSQKYTKRNISTGWIKILPYDPTQEEKMMSSLVNASYKCHIDLRDLGWLTTNARLQPRKHQYLLDPQANI